MSDTKYKPMSQAAETLVDKNKGVTDNSDIKERKKKIIKDIVKKKNGKDVFDPEPEISEKDTIVKT